MSPWSPVCPVHVTPFSQADPAPGPDSSVKKVKKEAKTGNLPDPASRSWG